MMIVDMLRKTQNIKQYLETYTDMKDYITVLQHIYNCNCYDDRSAEITVIHNQDFGTYNATVLYTNNTSNHIGVNGDKYKDFKNILDIKKYLEDKIGINENNLLEFLLEIIKISN